MPDQTTICASNSASNGTKKKTTKLSRYSINNMAVLLGYDMGFGTRGLGNMAAMLGLKANMDNNHRGWKLLQDNVGEKVEELAALCMAENIKKEQEMTLEKEGNDCKWDGRIGVTISLDAGWQKRSSWASMHI